MMHEGTSGESVRSELERLMASDLRELTSESDWIARAFAEQNNLSANEFRALIFVMMAEARDVRLTAGDLRKQMGLSGAAITYLVERMTECGHLRRESDPADRRKVILRYGEHGMDVARRFFAVLAEHNKAAMADLSEADMEAAHRTFCAMIAAMKTFRDDRPAATGPAARG